ncbi:SANT/Myb_domain [Hexamita inflata]|uniref:SANT/Myb domain n=1 Tax=Hexamita inflata TaxID=28002 RepID=A0AA86PNZ7_9EUKA|nr:SANT/Myb domain [Hexamita inflata]
MQQNPQQAYYAALYREYVNSTDAIYGLSFRSARSTSEKAGEKAKANSCPVENTLTNPSFFEILTDASTDLSAIQTQPNETMCRGQKRTAAEDCRFIRAIEECGQLDYKRVSAKVGLPVHIVMQQAADLFQRIDKESVTREQWMTLSQRVDISEFRASKYCEASAVSVVDFRKITETFKSAFSMTSSSVFSLAYCCGQFGIAKKAMVTIVQQLLDGKL